MYAHVPCEQAGNGRADHCKVCPCAEVNVRAGSLTYSNILTRNPGVLASYIDFDQGSDIISLVVDTAHLGMQVQQKHRMNECSRRSHMK